jgi:hypothetical protein
MPYTERKLNFIDMTSLICIYVARPSLASIDYVFESLHTCSLQVTQSMSLFFFILSSKDAYGKKRLSDSAYAAVEVSITALLMLLNTAMLLFLLWNFGKKFYQNKMLSRKLNQAVEALKAKTTLMNDVDVEAGLAPPCVHLGRNSSTVVPLMPGAGVSRIASLNQDEKTTCSSLSTVVKEGECMASSVEQKPCVATRAVGSISLEAGAILHGGLSSPGRGLGELLGAAKAADSSGATNLSETDHATSGVTGHISSRGKGHGSTVAKHKPKPRKHHIKPHKKKHALDKKKHAQEGTTVRAKKKREEHGDESSMGTQRKKKKAKKEGRVAHRSAAKCVASVVVEAEPVSKAEEGIRIQNSSRRHHRLRSHS